MNSSCDVQKQEPSLQLRHLLSNVCLSWVILGHTQTAGTQVLVHTFDSIAHLIPIIHVGPIVQLFHVMDM